MEWLQLRAFYERNMHELSSRLEEEETDLSGEIQQGDILNYLFTREIKEDLHRLHMAYEKLGIRLGEGIPTAWLEGLSQMEKHILLMRFKGKRRYSEIADQVSLPVDVVRHTFNHSLREVIKKAGGEEHVGLCDPSVYGEGN